MPDQPAEQSAVLAEVTAILRSVLEDQTIEVSLETTSDDIPGWDSMNHVAIVVEAECRFDIQFLTAEIEDLKSVGELVRLIQVKSALTHA